MIPNHPQENNYPNRDNMKNNNECALLLISSKQMLMNSKLVKLPFSTAWPQFHHNEFFSPFFPSAKHMTITWNMAAIQCPIFIGYILPPTFSPLVALEPVYQLPSCQLPVSFHILPLFSQSMCCLLVSLGPRHTHFNHSIQH